jgi:small subunit ribosomal protein S5
MKKRNAIINGAGLDLKEEVVSINRVTKVTKGGKTFRFAALVVVGNNDGVVGYGQGKAREVSLAIAKAVEAAKRNLIRIQRKGTTLPHEIIGRHGGGEVVIRPASEGTGVIAGAAVRAVMELAGVQNILTKSIGSSNPQNVVRACFDALSRMMSTESVAERRGKTVEEMGAQS